MVTCVRTTRKCQLVNFSPNLQTPPFSLPLLPPFYSLCLIFSPPCLADLVFLLLGIEAIPFLSSVPLLFSFSPHLFPLVILALITAIIWSCFFLIFSSSPFRSSSHPSRPSSLFVPSSIPSANSKEFKPNKMGKKGHGSTRGQRRSSG